MRVCYHCGKAIKETEAIDHIPTLWLRQLGDFSRVYHPWCYKKEGKISKEMNNDKKRTTANR